MSDFKAGHPSVSVISAVPRHLQVAVAMSEQGWLLNYLGPLFAPDATRGLGRLGVRVAPGIGSLPYRPLLVDDLSHKALRQLGVGPGPRTAISSTLTSGRGLLTRTGDVLHFGSGSGLGPAKRARRRRAVLVCDRRALHPLDEEQRVRRYLDVDYRHPERSYFSRVSRELSLADVIVVPSTLVRDSLREHGYENDIVVVPLGVDTTLFCPTKESLSRPATGKLLFVGSSDPRKGLGVASQAVEVLGDVELHVVGGDAGDSGDGKVKHLGRRSQRALAEIYRSYDALVLPSFVDAFGLVALEAMASGLPAVVSSSCGVADIIRNSSSVPGGAVFETGEAEDLASRLEVVLTGAPRMRADARKIALGYDWSEYRRRLVKAYESRIIPLIQT